MKGKIDRDILNEVRVRFQQFANNPRFKKNAPNQYKRITLPKIEWAIEVVYDYFKYLIENEEEEVIKLAYLGNIKHKIEHKKRGRKKKDGERKKARRVGANGRIVNEDRRKNLKNKKCLIIESEWLK